MDSQIKVVIAAELKKQGFDKAEKATSGLEKSFKALGATLLATFSAQKIISFSKQAVKAFEEDQKAAMRLSQTLKSLGLGFADPSIKAYITNVESSANVSDQALRPALEKLLRTTQSVTASQELLNLAIDISRGSGVDLVTVASDLSRAYVGQTRSLSKYNIGLTQAELKTKSFAELQAILNKQFSGQNATYLTTYAGKIEALSIAFDNAQEIIGESLTDAFLRLAGDNGIQAATDAMEDFATQLSDVITGISVMFDQLDRLTTWNGWSLLKTSNIPVVGSWLEFFGELGKEEKARQIIANPRQAISPRNVEAATASADKAAIKRSKELAALQKKAAADAAKRAAEAAKREREQQALKRAGTIFDMENIQITAALQGKVTEDQRLRLLALFAINNGAAEAAEKLSLAVLATNSAALASIGVIMKAGDSVDDVIKKIIESQTKLFLTTTGIANIPKAKDPFSDWPNIMAAILADIARITAAINNMPKWGGGAPSGGGGGGDGGGGGGGDGGAGGNGGGGNNGDAGAGGNNPPTPPAFPGLTPGYVPTPSEVITAITEGIPAEFAATSLATDANILAAARYTAELLAIQAANALANQLSSDRYTAMLSDIMANNQAANDLMAARYAAMQNYYMNINVAGSVVTETDLVTTLTDAIYVNQKGGTPITYRATAI